MTRSAKPVHLCFVLALAGTTSAVHAQLSYVSATRSVTATSGSSQTITDNTLNATFNQSASASQLDPFGSSQTASASSVLESILFTDRITYTGGSSANDGISASSGSGVGSASGSVTVRFTLASPSSYVILGNLPSFSGSFFSNAGSSLSERLVQVNTLPNVTIFSQGTSSIGGGTLSNLTGTLPAGTYDYFVSFFSSTAPNGSGTSSSGVSFARQFVIPSPAGTSVLALAGLVALRRRRD